MNFALKGLFSNSDKGNALSQGNGAGLVGTNGSKTAISLPRKVSNEKMPSVFTRQYPLRGNIATNYSQSDPVAVLFDQTGSMSTWPGVFINELPNLLSFVDGLGKYSRLYEVSFGAIGDARNNEHYPVQLCGFTTNIVSAKKSLESIYPEGKGGGNSGESYDLGFYGLASRLDLAPNQRGFAVILGDEPYFKDTKKDEVKAYFGEEAKHASIYQSLAAIRQKGLDVYALLKEPGVVPIWTDLLGKGFVATLDTPEKVVQAIVGIMAGRAGRKKEFICGLSNGKNKSIANQVATALDDLRIAPKGLLGA